jgi:hypothetical protein
MNAARTVLLTLLLAMSGAQAQLVDQPATLSSDTAGRYGPLAEGFKRYTPFYGRNETANPNDKLFPGFRTDPRLVFGFALNDYLAIEGGYAHLRDEGFHKIDTFDARRRAVESAVSAGALGAVSNTTYLAAKVTVPVTERLSAYGKLGVSQSTVTNDNFATKGRAQAAHEARYGGKAAGPFGEETSTGAYGAVGAKYQLNKRTTLSGEYTVNGSADKFKNSNASGLKGSVGIGF